MAKVIGEVKKLQEDKQTWRERTKVLYYRSYENLDFGDEDEDFMDLDTLMAVLSEEEWEEQLTSRAQQVHDWANKNALREHPSFHKYFRMNALGIPMEAAKNACEMDGYDPRVMDLDASRSLESQLDSLDTELKEILQEYVQLQGLLNRSTFRSRQRRPCAPQSLPRLPCWPPQEPS